MARILLTEHIATAGIELLEADGHDIDVKIDLTDEHIATDVQAADVLVIRPETSVTKNVLAAARGIVVVDAPSSDPEAVADQIRTTLAKSTLAGVDGRKWSQAGLFLPLAEALGSMFWHLTGGRARRFELAFRGAIADQETDVLTLGALNGYLNAADDGAVTYAESMHRADALGLEVHESKGTITRKYVSMLIVRDGRHSIAGTVVGRDRSKRIVMIDGIDVEITPTDHMVVVRNNDSPGIVGAVGNVLASEHINIANMALGRDIKHHSAVMVVSTDQPIGADMRDRFSQIEGVTEVSTLG